MLNRKRDVMPTNNNEVIEFESTDGPHRFTVKLFEALHVVLADKFRYVQGHSTGEGMITFWREGEVIAHFSNVKYFTRHDANKSNVEIPPVAEFVDG